MDEMLTSNQYKVLETMYDHTVMIGDSTYCPLSQSEVAKKLGLSRPMVNKFFSDLKKAGYIEMIVRGKWRLSGKASEMLRVTRKL
ncbi:MAG TPA: hypothetical protein DCL38_04760 [Lachnospiraceae bacterium]|nr:hypothetical protein [Lachnospiraceae bacterium]